jgi:gliding-associated putative ABC transporter substrate-binding component GldG
LGLINTLRAHYELSFIKIDRDSLEKKNQALIILKPANKFTEEEKFVLDQFIMRGGNVLFFIDRMKTNIEEMEGGKSFAIVQDLNLDDMLFKYGVRLEYNLIKDLQCGVHPIVTGNVGDQPQITLMSIPFLLLATTNDEHMIGKNLNQVYAKFVSKISPINIENVKHTPLLFSSFYSYCVGNPVVFDLNELKYEPDRKIYCQGPIPVAYLLEGKFSSLYKGRLAPEGFEKIEQLNEGEGKVLVTSGADLALNAVVPKKKQIFPLGMDPFMQQQFANQDFILSSLAYMVEEIGLINAKNKNYKIHLLDNKIVAEYSLLIQIINILLPLLLNFLMVIIFYIKRRSIIFKS